MTGGTVAVNNPWRYVSAYQDGTGLYKMGQRYYDPSTGRFTQQDPIHDPLDPKSIQSVNQFALGNALTYAAKTATVGKGVAVAASAFGYVTIGVTVGASLIDAGRRLFC